MMSNEQLKEILKEHQKWLDGEGGRRADLRSLIGIFEYHKDSFETEHKKGKWLNWSKINTAYSTLDCADCSVCGAIEVPLGNYTSYCPNCGAEMED